MRRLSSSGPRPPGKQETDEEAKRAAVSLGEFVDRVGQRAPAELNLDHLFLLYATYCGDIKRTANTAGVSEDFVAEKAASLGWTNRIQSLIDLRKADKSVEVQRVVCRTTNFIQAFTLQCIIDDIIHEIQTMERGELIKMLFVEKLNRNGEGTGQFTLSLKAFADLATALEKVHWLIYQANSDTVQERTKRKAEKEEIPTVDIHARLSQAFASMRKITPEQMICDATERTQRRTLERIEGCSQPGIPATPLSTSAPPPPPSSEPSASPADLS